MSASEKPCSCGCGDTVKTCKCPASCACRQPGGSCYVEKTAALGLWDRIRAKRERGEAPAKRGDKDYPDSKSWKKVTGISKKQAGTPAWQRAEGKNDEGGLNAKGRASYNKATGGHLKAPVTEKNPSGDRAKRQNSFCSRMCGMKKHETGSETKKDPDSRINKSLRKWNCKCSSAQEFGEKLAELNSGSINNALVPFEQAQHIANVIALLGPTAVGGVAGALTSGKGKRLAGAARGAGIGAAYTAGARGGSALGGALTDNNLLARAGGGVGGGIGGALLASQLLPRVDGNDAAEEDKKKPRLQEFGAKFANYVDLYEPAKPVKKQLPPHEVFNNALMRAEAAGETPTADLFKKIDKEHDDKQKEESEKTSMANLYAFGAKLAKATCVPCDMPNGPANKKHMTGASPAVLEADERSEELGKPETEETEHSEQSIDVPGQKAAYTFGQKVAAGWRDYIPDPDAWGGSSAQDTQLLDPRTGVGQDYVMTLPAPPTPTFRERLAPLTAGANNFMQALRGPDVAGRSTSQPPLLPEGATNKLVDLINSAKPAPVNSAKPAPVNSAKPAPAPGPVPTQQYELASNVGPHETPGGDRYTTLVRNNTQGAAAPPTSVPGIDAPAPGTDWKKLLTDYGPYAAGGLGAAGLAALVYHLANQKKKKRDDEE